MNLAISTRRIRPTAIFASIAILCIAFGFIMITAPARGEAKASVDIEQCSNSPSTCDASHASNWQKGNLGSNNSLYLEGQSVPYRSVISGLSVGESYAVRIGWDSTVNGRHAVDYLTDFDRSESGADPCATALCSGAPVTLGIPIDSRIADSGVAQVGGQHFSLWGGFFVSGGSTVSNGGNLCATSTCTIESNPSPYSFSGDYSDGSHTSIEIFFTATSTSAVLAWGGHISSRLDWGATASAVDIAGSPYHMSLNDFRCTDATNCSAGERDLSMNSDAIVFPGSITITKQADPQGSTSFGFTGSPSPLGAFSLIDDGTAANSITFSDIVDFQNYTITELAAEGWDLDSVTCSVAYDYGGSQSVNGREAVIDLAEGESVTCVFANSESAPATTTTTSTTSTSTTSSTTSTTIVDPSSTTTTDVESSTTVVSPTTTERRRTTGSSRTVSPTTTGAVVTLVATTTPGSPEVLSGEEDLPATGSESRPIVVLGMLLVFLGFSSLTLLGLRRLLNGR